MAVRKRAAGGAEYSSFSSRMRSDIYADLNDWAWENRLTLSAACSELLEKALKAERGAEYNRRKEPAIAAAK